MSNISKFTTYFGVLLLGLLASTSAFAGGGGDDVANYNETVMAHIGDANDFHVVGDLHIPLPMMLWSTEDNRFLCKMSSAFHDHKVIDGYVLDHHSVVRRIKDAGARENVHHADSITHEGEFLFLHSGNDRYELESQSSLIAGSSFIDLSISKNVFTMILAVLILFFIFMSVKRAYTKRAGKAPSGMQNFFETLVVFVRDDVAKPNIGPKYEKYLPFILSLFFFILVLNLMGLIPFFPGSANVTGNIGVTLVLAVFTFLVTNISGNKHYWGHILWMPGIPVFVKPLLAIVEVLGLFIKPFTLLIRLMANISAGHIIILSIVGVVFLLADSSGIGGGIGGSVIAVPFLLLMNVLEIFVAFLQAFVFALLSSLYIGAAIEDHDHH